VPHHRKAITTEVFSATGAVSLDSGLLADAKIDCMEKVVRIFKSHAEADAVDAEERRKMTPEQRVEIFFAIQQRGAPDAAEPRLARVCRVLELKQS